MVPKRRTNRRRGRKGPAFTPYNKVQLIPGWGTAKAPPIYISAGNMVSGGAGSGPDWCDSAPSNRRPKRRTFSDAKPLPSISTRSSFKNSHPTILTYVVASGDHVKIGRAERLMLRIQGLQVGSPFPLELLAVFESISEPEAHAPWSDIWVRGEWFQRTAELEAWAFMFDESVRLASDFPEVRRAVETFPVLRFPAHLPAVVEIDSTARRWKPAEAANG